MAETATLSGIVFRDANRNGRWEAGDESLEPTAVTVTLYAYDPAQGDPSLGNQYGALISVTVTAGGRYTFTGLAAGGYVVALALSAGMMHTTLSRFPVRVDADDRAPEFGLILAPNDGTGQAVGVVFEDANNDGRYTPGERGLAGVSLTIAMSGSAPVATSTETVSEGGFSVALPPGTATMTAEMGARVATGPNPAARSVAANQASGFRFAQGGRPNFVFILTDDQPYQTIIGSDTHISGVLETVSERVMPHTWAEVFGRGLVFTDAHATTPLCCPSRANLFSGRYAHNNGVINNSIRLDVAGFLTSATVVSYLADMGYYNGLVGKYLNSYDYDVTDVGRKPEEFHFWAHRCESNSTTPGSRPCYEYWGAEFNLYTATAPLAWTLITGYVPYIERDYALAFLDNAAGCAQPFLLVYSSLTPHSQTTLITRPEGIDSHKWADPAPDEPAASLLLTAEVGLHGPPSFNVINDTSPHYLRAGPVLTGADLELSDGLRLGMLQSLQSLDRTILSLTRRLETLGMFTNTVVIYMSDNGFLFGEHKAVRKTKVYQESSHVPFAMRYPARLLSGRVVSQMAANIDVAPTILDLAGYTGTVTPGMDGMSLAPLFTSTRLISPERAIVIEGWAPELPPIHAPYAAIRTRQYLYVENECDLAEFYPISDRWQITNTAEISGAFDAQEAEARSRLAALGLSRGTTACARAHGRLYLALMDPVSGTISETAPYTGFGGRVVISYGVGVSATALSLSVASGIYTTTSYLIAPKTEGYVISPNVRVTVTLQGFGVVTPAHHVITDGFAPGSTNGPYDFLKRVSEKPCKRLRTMRSHEKAESRRDRSCGHSDGCGSDNSPGGRSADGGDGRVDEDELQDTRGYPG